MPWSERIIHLLFPADSELHNCILTIRYHVEFGKLIYKYMLGASRLPSITFHDLWMNLDLWIGCSFSSLIFNVIARLLIKILPRIFISNYVQDIFYLSSYLFNKFQNIYFFFISFLAHLFCPRGQQTCRFVRFTAAKRNPCLKRKSHGEIVPY